MLHKIFNVTVIAGFLWAASSAAALRQARCKISSDEGGLLLDAPCAFSADRTGSFTLDPVRGKYLIPPRQRGDQGILSLTLDVISVGVGEVRGLTSEGINSRWGQAIRSKSDRACWVGSDFRVCVR